MWRSLRGSTAVLTLAVACWACGPVEPPAIPSPPTGARSVSDWSAFDQTRSNQLRSGLAELAQRFPRGEVLDLQIWQLQPAVTWDEVRSHYTQQQDWQTDAVMKTQASPIIPDAQIFLDARRAMRLEIALFRARPGVADDTAVLIVQRARVK